MRGVRDVETSSVTVYYTKTVTNLHLHVCLFVVVVVFIFFCGDG